jgi:ribonuclease HI
MMVMRQLTIYEALGMSAPTRSSEVSPNSNANPSNQGDSSSHDTAKLNILQWNAHTLNPYKADEISRIATHYEANILCISELGHLRAIPGFNCIIASDLHTQTGIFVESTVTTKIIRLTDPCLSYLPARIIGQGIKLIESDGRMCIILHIYIPPDASNPDRAIFWENLKSFVWSHSDTPMILCGDINTKTPLLCPNHTENHIYFDEFVEATELHIMNTGLPTRHENALDACIANTPAAQHITLWQPLEVHCSSDHQPCLIETNHVISGIDLTKKGHTPMSFINIKKSLEGVIKWLHDKHQRPDASISLTALWNAMQENLVISTSWQPVVSFWNDELSRLKRKRNIAYRNRKTSDEAFATYKNLDQQFKHAFRKAKRDFQRKQVETICQEDPSGARSWAICKTLEPEMRKRRKQWRTNTLLPEEQANRIAAQFSAISNDSTCSPSEADVEQYDHLIGQIGADPDQFHPITTEEIRRAVSQCRLKGAAGSDRISPRLFKQACEFPIFINAFKAGLNAAYRTGIFPDEWKIAKVIPLPKPNSEDFRPISLLNIMSKIFEKILEQRLRESVSDQLSPVQFGCRAGHNTTQALCRFAHHSGIARSNNLRFGALAFDFSKAYDRVPRIRLINKLGALGVRGHLIRMVDSWLTNRQLAVYHRRATSRPFTLSHGIPQGSSLSVLLWLVYINDLATKLKPESTNLYVDDTLVWASGRSKTQVRNSLAAEAQLLADWADENKVNINWGKTQLIYNTTRSSDPSLQISGQEIKPTTMLRYLGVNFLSNNDFRMLTFDLKTIGADIRRRAAVIHRLHRFQFPQKIVRRFTEGFVHAKLRYVSPLLGPEAYHSPESLDPLEKGLRAAIRTELGAFRSTPIPLLYQGAQRPLLKQLIERDATRLVLRSVAQNTVLGQEYQEWDGFGDGRSPLDTAQSVLEDLDIPNNAVLLPIRPISIRVRDALQRCQYYYTYSKEDALRMHANNLLLKPASISLWCDGSFISTTSTIGAAALWYDANNQLVDYRQDSKELASSSYEGELHALLLGLKMIRDHGPTRETIRIYTDSKSVISHLYAIGFRYRNEDDLIKECAHLIARLTETNTVAFHWIPGHENIGFNHFADIAAKQALQLLPVQGAVNGEYTHTVRFSTYNLSINKRMQASSTAALQAMIRDSSFRDYPSREPFKVMQAQDVVLGPLFRMRSGHTFCRAHLFNLGIISSEENICRMCSHPNETVEHVFLHCPQLAVPLQDLRTRIAESGGDHVDVLRRLMWKQPRRLEMEIVKAIKAGARV